jgi:protein-tyrosine phosphatase
MAKVFWIESNPPRRLAIVLRPPGSGKIQETLDEYRQSGIEILVSLLETEEAAMLGLADEASAAEKAGIEFLHYPMADMGVPQAPDSFNEFTKNLAHRLRAGRSIGIHCRGSVGRSTLAAACALIHLGWTPQKAIDAIGAARGMLVPQTQEQEDWILNFQV